MALFCRQSISVVFPAFNEERNVADAIEQANDCLEDLTADWEIIVVDDGSRDRTAEIIDAIAGRDPRVKTVHHAVNQGYGAALRSGIQIAKKDLIFFSDADLQFHLTELPLLLVWAEQFDAVIGYRHHRNDPFYRKVFAFGWNVLVRLVLGLKVRDIDCAFKLFRSSLFRVIKMDAVGAMVNTDILVQAMRMGFKIKQVPVTHFERRAGAPTGARLRVIVKAFRELARLHFKLRSVDRIFVPYDRRQQHEPVAHNRRHQQRRRHNLPINFPDRRRRMLVETAAQRVPGCHLLPNTIRTIGNEGE